MIYIKEKPHWILLLIQERLNEKALFINRLMLKDVFFKTLGECYHIIPKNNRYKLYKEMIKFSLIEEVDKDYVKVNRVKL